MLHMGTCLDYAELDVDRRLLYRICCERGTVLNWNSAKAGTRYVGHKESPPKEAVAGGGGGGGAQRAV